MCDGKGKTPNTFCLAYVCSPIYWDLRQLGYCRHLSRGYGSPVRFTAWPAAFRKVRRDTIRCTYPRFHKDYSQRGRWCAFPIHKGYCGKPAHHTGVSNLNGFWIAKTKPPGRSRDALGLIAIYPRPDEQRTQNAASEPESSSRQTRYENSGILQKQYTIDFQGSQDIPKYYDITVYPFTHSANG